MRIDILYEFDKYHKQHIIRYAAHHELVDMLTLLVLCDDLSGTIVPQSFLLRVRSFPELRNESRGQSLCALDDESLNIRTLLFMLSEPTEHIYDPSRRHRQWYMKLLCEFLRDPHRSGEHCVNGTKYAQAALSCLESICGPRNWFV